MLYLYGLREGPPLGAALLGIDDAPIEWLAGDGWSAATSAIAARPEVSAEHLAAHDDAARRAASGAAFLPARFGQVFAAPGAIGEAMTTRRDAIRAALESVRGCVQMTVRLFGAPRAPAPIEDSEAFGPGARFLAARRSAAAPPPEVQDLRRRLGQLVVAERWLASIAPGMLGTLAHLVRENAVESYRALIPAGPLGAARSVRLSGPWLPYAFAPAFEP